jgi:hypothetical protein
MNWVLVAASRAAFSPCRGGQGGAIFGFRDFGFRLTIDYAYRIHLPLEPRVTRVGVASPWRAPMDLRVIQDRWVKEGGVQALRNNIRQTMLGLLLASDRSACRTNADAELPVIRRTREPKSLAESDNAT